MSPILSFAHYLSCGQALDELACVAVMHEQLSQEYDPLAAEGSARGLQGWWGEGRGVGGWGGGAEGQGRGDTFSGPRNFCASGLSRSEACAYAMAAL